MSYFDEMERDAQRALESLIEGKCGCWTCFKERGENPWHMVVCKTCGNKRCPHANNHEFACTGSNEPGQQGSAYSAQSRAESAR